MLSPVAVADLLTILPTLLQLAFGLFYVSAGCGESSFLFAKFVRLIRIMRVMRMIRVLRLGARISARADNVVHHVASVVTTLVTRRRRRRGCGLAVLLRPTAERPPTKSRRRCRAVPPTHAPPHGSRPTGLEVLVL